MSKLATIHSSPDSAEPGEDGLSDRDFNRLRRLIHEEAGITLSVEKRMMLELRIKRRLRALKVQTYAAYCDMLFSKKGQTQELASMLDVVTTNKTDFFREPAHFDFLTARALPDILAHRPDKHEIVLWSAGCSSGEEPYTLAIVMEEYRAAHPGLQFRILATDLSNIVLEKATRAIYPADAVRAVPAMLRQKYFLRSRDHSSELVRVAPELRRHIEFQRLNFMDEDYGLQERVDAVFCRNVIIYFERSIQQQVLRKLTDHLLPGGYLFVGHSETLHDMDLPLTPVAPALYRKHHVQH